MEQIVESCFAQTDNAELKDSIEDTDQNAERHGNDDNDGRASDSFLAGKPGDLLHLADAFAEVLTDSLEETGLLFLLRLFDFFFVQFCHNTILSTLLGFLVQGVFAAETAVLVHFKSVRIILLIFLRVIISLLAFGAGECNFDSHLSAPPDRNSGLAR